MQQLMSVGTEPTYGAGRHPSLKAAFPDVSVQRTQPRSQLAGRHEGNLQWQAHFEHTSDALARFETNLTSKRANKFFDNR